MPVRLVALLACVLLLLATVPHTATPVGGEPTNATPSIVAAYPNPAAAGDTGEFVVVRLPDGVALGALSVADGDGVTRPAPRRVRGTVALATDPERARALTSHRVVALQGDLALGNDGDRITLRYRGRSVDTLTYRRAPEGELYRGDAWRPVGPTSGPPVTVGNVTVETFALPDAPEVPAAVLRSADRRLLLGGYTFGSRRAADLLVAAADRGVEVRVLVEGGPVGGIDRRQARLLDRLVARGIEVRVIDGPLARYRFHHPKYAVADDRVLVTSENWAPGGTGGRSTRGWGAVVESPPLADTLADVFRTDAGWHDATPWRTFRRNATLQPAPPAPDTSYPTRFPARTRKARSVRLVLAPDDAGSTVGELIASADRRLLIAQPRVDPDHAFVRAAVAAARRGVAVRLLLGSAWYEREQNRETARQLRATARREGLDLAVRLVEPRSRFDRLHLKGVVVDGEAALVGSLNWNAVSVGENREVALIVRGAAARYYARVFRADWRGGAWRVPAGALVAAALAVAGAVLSLRRAVGFTAERRRRAARRESPRR